MNNYQPILKAKIEEIGSAIMYCQSSSVLRFPTQIIHTIKVDEAGNIWFTVSHPTQHIDEFDKVFRIRLEYYRKGKRQHIKIDGQARIVTDPEELNALMEADESLSKYQRRRCILIGARILSAELYDLEKPAFSGWLSVVKNYFRSFIFQEAQTAYRWQPAA